MTYVCMFYVKRYHIFFLDLKMCNGCMLDLRIVTTVGNDIFFLRFVYLCSYCDEAIMLFYFILFFRFRPLHPCVHVCDLM